MDLCHILNTYLVLKNDENDEKFNLVVRFGYLLFAFLQ
jgi:hypothetical protein